MCPKRWLFVGALLVLVGIVGWWAAAVILGADRAADASAQLALMEEAAKLLEAYRDKHGEYPKSLNVFRFTYPDGGDESHLATLRYRSDGKTFSLTAKSAYDDEEFVIDAGPARRVKYGTREH